MGFRRGFKTEAEDLAVEVRSELGLQAVDRLDPRALADHLEIPVVTLSDLGAHAPQALYHFHWVEPEAFSAATIFFGQRRVIVHNDSHTSRRQASDLAHELSHGLLMHPPAPPLDHRGCRFWDQRIEDEAAFLAGALLIPRGACISMALRGLSVSNIALQFGVSDSMASYRLNISGARKIAVRSQNRRQGRSA